MEVVTGAMCSLVPKLGELLKEEYNLHKGVRAQVEYLKRELESIHAAVRKVAEAPHEQLDEQVKLWKRDVRELSYDMEDVVDTFMVRVDQDSSKGLMESMFRLYNKFRAHRQIASEIQDIKDRVQDVAHRRKRYKVDDVVANPAAATAIDPRLSALYNKVTDLVGIHEPREELIKRLTEQQWKVVSVVGFGGLGKTTLAKAVFDSMKAEFDCTAFVSVSQKPDMTKIFKKMLHQLDEEKYAHINEASRDETQLIDELRKFLMNKRYFIVIDDIWDIQQWKIIRHALVENTCGSRIITTTRNFDIAEQVGGSYKLKSLTLECSKILFYGRIFGSEEECPEQFKEVSEKILKKCGGIPLAIITMASMLAVHRKMGNLSEWYEVYGSIGSGLGDSPDVKNMRMILSLSYYSLPFHLRTCLLYLSVYPEDYEIPRDDLIWKWISEGFVQHRKKGDSLFELGESYFNELINRSMIQPVDLEIPYNWHTYECIFGCRVHDMVLDLICSLSSEENFVTILDDIEQSTPHLQSKVRRISLQNSKVDQTTPFVSVSQVRSITVFRHVINLMPPFSGFAVLRVLDLIIHYGERRHLNLGEVGNLCLLRYLRLRVTYFLKLPEEIGNLQFLQVLDVDNMVKLPSTVVKLRRLMCLLCGDYFIIIPNGMGNLTSMEVLKGRISPNNVKELRNLTRLRELRITLHDGSLELEEALVESLCDDLHKIQILVLRGYFESLDLLGERWVPSQHLHVFDSYSNFGRFSTLPVWVKRNPSFLSNLSVLHIKVKELCEEDLQILGRLPSLRSLVMNSSHQTPRLLLVGADGFRCVKTFRLYCGPSGLIMFGRGALPRAEKVGFEIGALVAEGDSDFGLGNLSSLQKVSVTIRFEGATHGEDRQVEARLRHAIHIHPNRPTLDVDFKRITHP